MMPKRIGRWGYNDVAEERSTGKFYRVVGFILDPAVCFREIGGDGERVEVANCPNELNDLVCYRREDTPEAKSFD
jgi:hypothetical protein